MWPSGSMTPTAASVRQPDGKPMCEETSRHLCNWPSQQFHPKSQCLQWRQQVEEDEEELQPPARPGTSAAGAASAEKARDGKPPAKPFLPVEEDDDDPGLIPDEQQIRCAAAL